MVATESMEMSLAEENRRLRRAMEELTLLNELAVDIARAREVGELVRTLVRRSLKAVGAEQGVVTLMDRGNASSAATLVRTSVNEEQGAFRPDEALLAWMSGNRRPLRLDDPRAHPIFGQFDWDDAVRSLLCVPLVAHGRLLGVLTLFNKQNGATQNGATQNGGEGGGFSEDDARLLTIIGMQSAQVIEAAQAQEERDRIRNVFGRHTAPAIVEELLRHEADPPGKRQHACIMFADLRGFTTYAENSEPEEVVAYLNNLFEAMSEEVASRGGVVHQLLGDGLLAYFGAPLARPDDCESAVAAALAIVGRLNAAADAGHLPPTRVGIGLHAGEVVAGTVGSSHHKEYKLTGDVVNTAARVEQLCKEYDAQVLATGAVLGRVPEGRFATELLGPVVVRGRSAPLQLYRLA